MVYQILHRPRITPSEGEHIFFHGVLKTYQQEHVSASDSLYVSFTAWKADATGSIKAP